MTPLRNRLESKSPARSDESQSALNTFVCPIWHEPRAGNEMGMPARWWREGLILRLLVVAVIERGHPDPPLQCSTW